MCIFFCNFAAYKKFFAKMPAAQMIEPWKLSKQSLVSILTEKHYTPSEFIDALGAPSFTALLRNITPIGVPAFKALLGAKVHRHMLFKRSLEIQSYTFTYRSQTVDGRDAVLSGRVTFLNNKTEGVPHQAKTLSLHFHQAFFHPEWAPSQNLMFMPLKVLWDSAVIEPDLQKWGINHGIEPDGGGSALHTARQMADCVVAALEVMRQRGVTLAPDGYATNWGSSQGALPTLYFAKWYDTEAPQWFREAVRLRATFAAEGTVPLKELTIYTYQDPKLVYEGHILLTAYYKAFSKEQRGGYMPEEFVPRWFSDPQYEVDGRKITFLDALSHYYPQITEAVVRKMTSYAEMVAPDMLTPDGKVDLNCPKLQAWLACLHKHNDLTDWTPAHQVYIAHSPADDMMPFEMVYDLYRMLSRDGQNPNVHMLSVPSMRLLPHGGLNPHFIVAFMGQIIMALVENPEDMRTFYKSVK